MQNSAFELCCHIFVLGVGYTCDLSLMAVIWHTNAAELSYLLVSPFETGLRWRFALERGLKFLPYCVPVWRAVRFNISSLLNTLEPPFMRPILQRVVSLAASGLTIALLHLSKGILDRVHPMAFALTTFWLYYPIRWLLPWLGVLNLERGQDYIMESISGSLVAPYRRLLETHRSSTFQLLLTDRTTLPSYKYEALHSRTMIRLLKIQAREKELSGISCDIITAELDLAPHYDAVSYVWGKSESSGAIMIGIEKNSCIPITKNASRVLASITPLRGTRYIWIDSICIDQSNTSEKEVQIPLMSKIYAGAQETVAFLNPAPNADTDAAIAFINRLSFFAASNGLQSDLVSKGNIRSLAKALTGAPVVPISDPGWQPLEDLVKNEYWSRLWIIQECIAAKELTIMYGNAPCNWMIFYLALALRMNPAYLYQSKQLTPPYAVVHISGILLNRWGNCDDNDRLPLSRLISAFAIARASVPADRVNALLGLSEDSLEPSLQPNSQKSTRFVYTNLVRHSLARGNFETFAVSGLCNPRNASNHPGEQSGMLDDLSDLPSWVPDLTCPGLCRFHIYHTRGYQAGKAFSSDFEISPDGYELKIKGTIFDVVRICSSDPDQTEIELDSMLSRGSIHELGWLPMRRVLEMYTLAQENLPSIYHYHQELDEAFWRTLVEDYDYESYPSRIDFSRAIEIMKTMWRYYEQDAAISEQAKTIIFSQANLIPSLDSTTGITQEDWVQIGIITGVLRYKAFAITENGYMAMVPPGTAPGDRIAIFAGCGVPQVLRKTDDNDECFVHWGESYVHGIMDGKGLTDKQEWLTLR